MSPRATYASARRTARSGPAPATRFGIAAQANEQAVIEFHKYLTFALADGVLTAEEEKSLHKFAPNTD